MNVLSQMAVPNPGHPAGFIFHISRCGSTLAARMLSALKSHRVLSEPQPFDGIVCARLNNPSVKIKDQILWLKGLMKSFGQRTDPSLRHLFIKFDSWHAMALPLIRRAFPQVPVLFLYRDPVEVLVSHRRIPGRHMVPGLIAPEWFGGSLNDIRKMNLTEYGVWVLARLFQAARAQADSAGMSMLNYARLPEALWAIDPFGLDFTSPEIRAMKAVSRFDSKNPLERFKKDSGAKQQAAGPCLRTLVSRGGLWAAYAALDRKGQYATL
jgi:hypothetical protein